METMNPQSKLAEAAEEIAKETLQWPHCEGDRILLANRILTNPILVKMERELEEANERCSSGWSELITKYNEERSLKEQLTLHIAKLEHGIKAFRDFGSAKGGTHYEIMLEALNPTIKP